VDTGVERLIAISSTAVYGVQIASGV